MRLRSDREIGISSLRSSSPILHAVFASTPLAPIVSILESEKEDKTRTIGVKGDKSQPTKTHQHSTLQQGTVTAARRFLPNPALNRSTCTVPAPLFSSSRKCRREWFSSWSLANVARQIGPTTSVSMAWSTATSAGIWKGKKNKTNDHFTFVDTLGKAHKAQNFPPTDGRRTWAITLEGPRNPKPRRLPPLNSTQFAPGTRIRTVLTKNGEHSKWVGTVLAVVRDTVAIVKYDAIKHPLPFPPPPSSGYKVRSVHFFSRPPPDIGRQQRLRYRRNAAAVAAAVALSDADPGRPVSPERHPPPTQNTPPNCKQNNHVNPNSRAPAVRGFRIGTLNCRTLTDNYRLQSLMGFMEVRGIDIITLQETRTQDIAETAIHGFNLVHAPADKTGYGGAAILLGPRCEVLDTKVVEDNRSIRATIRISLGKKFTLTTDVVSAYLPQRTNPIAQNDSMELITKILSKTGPAFIGCDANGCGEQLAIRADCVDAASMTGKTFSFIISLK